MKYKMRLPELKMPSLKMPSLRALPATLSAALPKSAGIAVAGVTMVALAIIAFALPNYTKHVSVAFVANAILSSNDIPRLVENMGNGHVHQDSCLHSSSSISSILTTGNGMYNSWSTTNAQTLNTGSNSWSDLYDYGACTVKQLLYGYDSDLKHYNYNGAYYDNGNNPCFQENGDLYLNYLIDKNSKDGNPKWNYVVIAEQTWRLANTDAHESSLSSLTTYYLPIFQDIQSTPVVLEPHAYPDDGNFDDVSTFQSMIHAGVLKYVSTLEQGLPETGAKIAPVGLAFQLVWEEDQDQWLELFYSDNIHMSLQGSYLYALVLYCTVYGKMPSKSSAIPKDIASLWNNARKLDSAYNATNFPSTDSAEYLYEVAERVAKKGYIPKSLVLYED